MSMCDVKPAIDQVVIFIYSSSKKRKLVREHLCTAVQHKVEVEPNLLHQVAINHGYNCSGAYRSTLSRKSRSFFIIVSGSCRNFRQCASETKPSSSPELLGISGRPQLTGKKCHHMHTRDAIVFHSLQSYVSVPARLATEGASLLLVDVNAESLEKARQEVEQTAVGSEAKPKILCQQADVTKEEDVRRYVKVALDNFGRIDGFFNNVCIAVASSLKSRQLIFLLCRLEFKVVSNQSHDTTLKNSKVLSTVSIVPSERKIDPFSILTLLFLWQSTHSVCSSESNMSVNK